MNIKDLTKELMKKHNRVLTKVVKSNETQLIEHFQVTNLGNNHLKIERSGSDSSLRIKYVTSIEVEELENSDIEYTVTYYSKPYGTDKYFSSSNYKVKMSEDNIKELIKIYDTILSVIDTKITQDIRVSNLLKSMNE